MIKNNGFAAMWVNKSLLLPLLSNQKMNGYLKEVADLCCIKKELTYHIARHTFATTVTLSNDVPIESVSKMLGHKNLRTTLHYAKILNKKLSNETCLPCGKKFHKGFVIVLQRLKFVIFIPIHFLSLAHRQIPCRVIS